MQNFISVGISLPREIVKKIDVERGDVSRSRFVFRLLEKSYCARNDRNRTPADIDKNKILDSPDVRFRGLSLDESRIPQ